MRAFIGIPIPDNLKKEIKGFQEKLAGNFADVKWVEMGNLHVTLSFLGEVNGQFLVALARNLKEVLDGWEPFSAKIQGPVVYPSVEEPRVLALGFSKNENKLADLGRKIAEVSGGEFKSVHITLGRFRRSPGYKKVSTVLKDFSNFKVGNLKVEKVLLMESTLIDSGPVYTVIEEFRLASA